MKRETLREFQELLSKGFNTSAKQQMETIFLGLESGFLDFDEVLDVLEDLKGFADAHAGKRVVTLNTLKSPAIERAMFLGMWVNDEIPDAAAKAVMTNPSIFPTLADGATTNVGPTLDSGLAKKTAKLSRLEKIAYLSNALTDPKDRQAVLKGLSRSDLQAIDWINATKPATPDIQAAVVEEWRGRGGGLPAGNRSRVPGKGRPTTGGGLNRDLRERFDLEMKPRKKELKAARDAARKAGRTAGRAFDTAERALTSGARTTALTGDLLLRRIGSSADKLMTSVEGGASRGANRARALAARVGDTLKELPDLAVKGFDVTAEGARRAGAARYTGGAPMAARAAMGLQGRAFAQGLQALPKAGGPALVAANVSLMAAPLIQSMMSKGKPSEQARKAISDAKQQEFQARLMAETQRYRQLNHQALIKNQPHLYNEIINNRKLSPGTVVFGGGRNVAGLDSVLQGMVDGRFQQGGY